MSKAVLAPGIERKRFPIGEERRTKLGQPSKEARERFPFYQALLVAGFDTPLAQLRWKIYVRTRCLKDMEFRNAIWYMCQHDVAFFAVTFCWIFEPRPPRALPYSPWMDQIDLLAWMDECFPVRSLGNSKTRGLGLTWLCTVFFYHKWLFWPECKIAVLTKDKDLLESDDNNSLIGKFVYLHEHMPIWVQLTSSKTPIMDRKVEAHSLKNVVTGAMIQGFVSTNTKLRSLRFTAIWADEFAFYGKDAQEWMVSSGGTTMCRFFISTWNSFNDMFHHIMYVEKSSMLKTFSYWQDNYQRWKGAYKVVNGRVFYIDKKYKHEPDYEFGVPDMVPEGVIRSPWVDAELLEPGTEGGPMQALRDIYGKDLCEKDSGFFRPEVRTALRISTDCEPTEQGLIDRAAAEFKLLPTLKSEVRVWGEIDYDKRGPFTAGFDLGAGAGASNSVMEVLDNSGVQVLEYGTNTADIKTFAADCVRIAQWICNGEDGVLFDFEANGQWASDFFTELERIGYGNVHSTAKKTTARLRGVFNARYNGTWNSDGNRANFTELGRAILGLEAVVKSKMVYEESKLFGRDDKDQPSFPRMSKLGHGDFMAALGVAWNRAKNRVNVENRDGHEIDNNLITEPWLQKTAVFCHSTRKRWSSNRR